MRELHDLTERGERGRITPKVMHNRVELDLPLTLSRNAR